MSGRLKKFDRRQILHPYLHFILDEFTQGLIFTFEAPYNELIKSGTITYCEVPIAKLGVDNET